MTQTLKSEKPEHFSGAYLLEQSLLIACGSESSGPKNSSVMRTRSLLRLLKEKASPNIKDLDGQSPLHCAIHKKWTDGVRILLEAKANLETQNKEELTPLGLAAGSSSLEIVDLLLLQKAPLENAGGNSPLHSAAFSGNVDMVKRLLDQKASITAVDPKGRNAFSCAVQKICTNRSILEPEETKKLLLLLGAKSTIDSPDTQGNTTLHYATVYGRVWLAEFLIRRGANINASNKEGLTPLGLLSSQESTPQREEAATLLLDNKASLKTQIQQDYPPVIRPVTQNSVSQPNCFGRFFRAHPVVTSTASVSLLVVLGMAGTVGYELEKNRDAFAWLQDSIGMGTPADMAVLLAVIVVSLSITAGLLAQRVADNMNNIDVFEAEAGVYQRL